MLFFPFDYPIQDPRKTLEVCPESWVVKNEWITRYGPKAPTLGTYGHWCDLAGSHLYIYKPEKSHLVLHHLGQTFRIGRYQNHEFICTNKSFFLWRHFVLKNGDKTLINHKYRDPDTFFWSLLAGLSFDDEYWYTPFNQIDEFFNGSEYDPLSSR